MCRMLAVVGQPNIELLAQFQNLALTGKVRPEMEPGHNDGWGIVGFQNEQPVYFGRSQKSAYQNGDFISAAERAVVSQSPLTVAHIRKATGGEVKLKNTHPFIKDGWIFCHNGTLYESEKLSIKQKPVGSSDSERLFIFLIEYISREIATPHQGEARNDVDRGHPFEKGVSPIIKKAIGEVKSNHDYTSLTFLLANKDHLLAYRDFNEESEEAAEYEKYYTLYHHQKPYIICSEPIGNLEVTPLRNKELLATSL